MHGEKKKRNKKLINHINNLLSKHIFKEKVQK